MRVYVLGDLFDCCISCVIKYVQSQSKFEKPCCVELPFLDHLVYVKSLSEMEEEAADIGNALIAEEEADRKARERKANKKKAARSRRKQQRLDDDAHVNVNHVDDEETSKSPHNETKELRILFTCPASGKLLLDPAICADGYTYDRAWLEDWVLTHDESPMTKSRLDHCSRFSKMQYSHLHQSNLR